MASRTKKAHQHSRKATDRELRSTARSRRPILISSHSEADPEAPVPSDAAIGAPTPEDFQRGPDAERPKPIVSINGNDVSEDESDCAA